jgi:hypothetical protein
MIIMIIIIIIIIIIIMIIIIIIIMVCAGGEYINRRWGDGSVGDGQAHGRQKDHRAQPTNQSGFPGRESRRGAVQ